MKKLLLVLFIISIGFGSFNFVEKAHFEFGNAIDDVERHWYDGRWIQEVRTGDSVFLMIDDIIDTNYIEGISDGEVLVCGDSIVAITKEVDSTGRYCGFQNIYPANRFTGFLAGINFKFCLWSDSLEAVLYLFDEAPYSREDYYNDLYLVHSNTLEELSTLSRSVPIDIVYGKNSTSIFSEDMYDESMELYPEPYHEIHYTFFAKSILAFSGTELKRETPLLLDGSFSETYWFHYIWCGGMIQYQKTQSGNAILGRSLIDVNGDDILDFLYSAFFRQHVVSYSCNEGIRELTRDETTISRNNTSIALNDSMHIDFEYKNTDRLFLFHGIDSLTNCLLMDSILFFGEEFESSHLFSELPTNFEYASKISDLDNDGIHELFGYDSTSLWFFGVQQQFEVKAGWNQISAPFITTDSISLILPFSTPNYFWYNPDSAFYETCDFFQQGKSYFIHSPIDTIVDFSGEEIDSIILNLKEGWNMCSGPSHIISTNPFEDDSTLLMPVYIFDAEDGLYREASNILPGQGFWIFSFIEQNMVIH